MYDCNKIGYALDYINRVWAFGLGSDSWFVREVH